MAIKHIRRRSDAGWPAENLMRTKRLLLLLCLTAAIGTAPAAESSKETQPDGAAGSDQEDTGPLLTINLPAGASKAPAPFEGTGWEELFDGETLTSWNVTKFAGRGEVQVKSGLIVMTMGNPFTGVNYTNSFPKLNYEVALDAMRVMGSDFFCGMTFPVGESHCSLVVGGWGGSLLGISSLDSMDASENETTKFVTFESGKWYRLRVRVTKDRIEVWVDSEKKIDVVTEGRRVSTRPGDIELSKPFGIACWQTAAALREIRVRKVDGPADPKPKGY